MPNWCENEIEFKGTKEDIDVLEKLLATGEHDFDFDLFLPYPQQFKELDDAHNEAAAAGVPWDKRPKNGYSQGGYEWCISNWGTNLRPESSSVHRDGDENLSAWCLTAWSPPLGVIQAISKMFPNLTITINYSEEGMMFEGFATYKKGVVIESEEHEMDNEEDDDIEEENFFGENEIAKIIAASTEPGFSNPFGGPNWITATKYDSTLEIVKYLGKDSSPVFPQGVSEIGIRAFAGCSNLNSLTIPDGVMEIAAFSFKGSSLTSIEIPGSVEVIGEGAFEGCKNLSSVILQEGIEYISDNAFNDCSSLSSIVIPGSVLELYEAFQGCTSLSSVIFEQANEDVEGGMYIGGEVFNGCINLQSVRMRGSDYEIDGEMFEGCPNVVIHAPKDSSAIEYAKAQRIKFFEES